MLLGLIVVAVSLRTSSVVIGHGVGPTTRLIVVVLLIVIRVLTTALSLRIVGGLRRVVSSIGVVFRPRLAVRSIALLLRLFVVG